MDSRIVINLLIQIPRLHYELGNASVYSLLVESGYFECHEEISEQAIFRELHKHTEYVSDWRSYSQDKRTSGWYLMEPNNGRYGIGYIPADGTNAKETLEYSDEVSACAAFIKLEIENIRGAVSNSQSCKRNQKK